MQLRFSLFLLFILLGKLSYSQYSISGYLDTPQKNKRVYLSLLKFNELNGISEKQILSSTVSDSLGYFSFEGNLLSEKHALYRIYTNVDEDVQGVQKYDTEDLKNFHNFIFSNRDTIFFEKNHKYWFSSDTNTNSIDKEWKEFGSFKDKVREEFLDFNNQNVINQSSAQFLIKLKSFTQQKETHPLTTLILLGTLPKNSVKKDLVEDPKFYSKLKSDLDSYYDNSFYAIQFKGYIENLNKKETQEKLELYKKLTYGFGVLCLALILGILLLILKLKKFNSQKRKPTDFTLTSQEIKVAELIIKNKTNKEIATELYISLNTVKTHIRNLYAKLEVSNRTEFVDIYQNHPRD